MSIRVAIVGPGRVGQALGRRLAEAGAELLGFVGRRADSAAAAVAFAGRGRVLAFEDLSSAQVVVLSVADPDLPAVVAAAAARAAMRRRSLWLHTSGRHGLEVLAPLAVAGGRDRARLGALHPAVPLPDALTGLRNLIGRPAVLLAEPGARRLLQRIVRLLGMVPLWSAPDADRVLYHAACALAANGLTALRAAVDEVFAAAGALSAADAALLAHALMDAALQACREYGPRAALSGPVVRGDEATVALHRSALLGRGAQVDFVYRALMTQALRLAVERGLPESAARGLRRALGAAMD